MTDQYPLLEAERIVIDWLVAEYGKSLVSPIKPNFWWEYTNEGDKQAYAEMFLGLNPNENNMKMLDALAVVAEARHIIKIAVGG